MQLDKKTKRAIVKFFARMRPAQKPIVLENITSDYDTETQKVQNTSEVVEVKAIKSTFLNREIDGAQVRVNDLRFYIKAWEVSIEVDQNTSVYFENDKYNIRRADYKMFDQLLVIQARKP